MRTTGRGEGGDGGGSGDGIDNADRNEGERGDPGRGRSADVDDEDEDDDDDDEEPCCTTEAKRLAGLDGECCTHLATFFSSISDVVGTLGFVCSTNLKRSLVIIGNCFVSDQTQKENKYIST